MSCAMSTSGLGGGRTYSSARAQRNMSDVRPCTSSLQECAMAPATRSPQKVPVKLRPSAAWFMYRTHGAFTSAKAAVAAARRLLAGAASATR